MISSWKCPKLEMLHTDPWKLEDGWGLERQNWSASAFVGHRKVGNLSKDLKEKVLMRSETIQDRDFPFIIWYTHFEYVNYLKWDSSITLLWFYIWWIFSWNSLPPSLFCSVLPLKFSYSIASFGKPSLICLIYPYTVTFSSVWIFLQWHILHCSGIDWSLIMHRINECLELCLFQLGNHIVTHLTEIDILHIFF